MVQFRQESRGGNPDQMSIARGHHLRRRLIGQFYEDALVDRHSGSRTRLYQRAQSVLRFRA
jgi:hypothetical protein